MASSSIPRTPVPTFSKAELDLADLCARALWHGLSFETGKEVISDAWLLDTFATPFYRIPSSSVYTATPLDVHQLIVVCKLKPLFRDMTPQHFQSGINCVHNSIFSIYSSWKRRSSNAGQELYGADCVKDLSDALAMKQGENRVVLASRMMFFVAPDMPCFNMNNKVAVAFGLQTRPHYYRQEYCTLMATGLAANNPLLSHYTMPATTHEIDGDTYVKVAASDWWQRRVMDIAILLRLGLANAVPGLNGKLQAYLANKP